MYGVVILQNPRSVTGCKGQVSKYVFTIKYQSNSVIANDFASVSKIAGYQSTKSSGMVLQSSESRYFVTNMLTEPSSMCNCIFLDYFGDMGYT